MHVPECGFWSRPFLSLAAEYVSRMSPLTLVHWVHDVTLRIAPTLLSHPIPFPAFHLFRVRVCVSVFMRVCAVAVLFPSFACCVLLRL